MQNARQWIGPALSGFFLAIAVTWSAETNALDAMRVSYEKARMSVETAADQQKKDALVQYGKALDDALKPLKQKGDLDGVLAIEKARKDFAAAAPLPDPDTEAINPAVAEPLAAYRRAVTAAGNEANKRIFTLQKQYAKALEDRVRQLTVEDKIEEAKVVKKALDDVRADIAIIEPLVGQAGSSAEAPSAHEAVSSKTATNGDASAKTTGPKALFIVKATWGTTGQRQVDVTDKIRQMVKDGRLEIQDYGFLGQKYWDDVKTLTVQYRYGNGFMKTVKRKSDSPLFISEQ